MLVPAMVNMYSITNPHQVVDLTCEYANSRPVMLNRISPTVMINDQILRKLPKDGALLHHRQFLVSICEKT
jgi:hypothetical protein